MKYQAYEEYKESGLSWLGSMPLHWELKKAKHLFRRIQRPIRECDGVVTAFRDGEVTLRAKRRMDGFTQSIKEIGYQGVRVGDLLVHAMDGFAGAIGVSDSNGKCSPVCSVCIPWQPGNICMPYFGYLVRQLAVTEYITSLAKGIRERSTEFRFSEFSALELAFPHYEEQQKIAAFLDYETAKIDTLIEKQQQLIKLLKEKRQAVISHAVTKGLDPNVNMKDSGVEWLGEVPSHWIVAGFKKYLEPIIDYRGKTPNKTDEGILLITARNIKNGALNYSLSQEYIAERDYEDTMSRGRPKIGDVLFTTEAPLGEVANVDCVNIALAQRIVKFCGQEGVLDNYYFKYLIMSSEFQQSLNLFSSGSTAKGIKAQRFVYLRKLLPPIKEQQKIAIFLDNEIKKIDELILKQACMAGLLKERRTALISAAVTGKIDVRSFTPPEPAKTACPSEVLCD